MSNKIKNIFCLWALLFFSTISQAEVVDKIVVVVNDEIITQQELDRVLFPIYMRYRTMYEGPELEEKLEEARKGVLTQFIQQKLLLSEAGRRKIEVTDREINEKVEAVRKNFKTESDFRKALAAENMNLKTLKSKFNDQIMIDKLIDTEIRRKISITPNEVKNFYERNKDGFNEPAKVKLSSILIKIDNIRNEKRAYKLANKILKMLKTGGDFAALARQYSDGPHKEASGDMGWVSDGELMDKINKIVFNMKEKEQSKVIRTSLGFHIFRVEEKMHPLPREFNEVKDEAEQVIYRIKIQEKFLPWVEKLKNDAYIAFK